MSEFSALNMIFEFISVKLNFSDNSVADGSEETEEEEENYDYNNDVGPLEPWGNKCKAKLVIVDELKKDTSCIHDFIPSGEYCIDQGYWCFIWNICITVFLLFGMQIL